ncbi:Translation initiation factor [Giardia lamblia P15]|uniref:Translation initiation factor n=1 Tax=Giardia intestinalis (strain P15) TaxID=658858 RepID=E1F724_GIAIA|nr:Translation initiation factor [Giardia lamblia P15]
MPPVTHAIILADTYSSFLDPIIRDTPALLLKIGGVYLLDILIHRLCTSGIDSITIVAYSYASTIQRYVDEDCHWSPKLRNVTTHSVLKDTLFDATRSLSIPNTVSIRVLQSSDRNIYACLKKVFGDSPDIKKSYEGQLGTISQFLLIDGPAFTNLNFAKAFEYHTALTNLHSSDNTDYLLTAILSMHTETSSLRPLIAPSIIIRDPETCELKNLIVDVTNSSAQIDLELPFEDKCHMNISSNLYLTGFYIVNLNFIKFFVNNETFEDTESMHTFLSSALDSKSDYSIKMGTYLLEKCESGITIDSPRLYQELNKAYIKGYFRPYSPETNWIYYKGAKTQFRSVSDWVAMGVTQLQSCGTLYCDESTSIPPNTIVAGDSLVHRNCNLEDGLTIDNSTLCDNVFIGAGSKIIDTLINSQTTIGKNCVLRRCYVGSNVHIEDGISLPCGSMVGNGVTINLEVLYQSIKMTFQAYFHCNFQAYLSFIIRYFLYLDDRIESALENAGFTLGSPLPCFHATKATEVEGHDSNVKEDNYETVEKLLLPDHIEKLKFLQSHQDTICRFFKNEISTLPSTIIVRFIPPIFLTSTRPSLSVLKEYQANSMSQYIPESSLQGISPEFRTISIREPICRQGSVPTLTIASADQSSHLLPPKHISVYSRASTKVSLEEEEKNTFLADMISGTVPITELAWPGVIQTTLNPLPNTSKYDEFFQSLVSCASNEMLRRPTEDDASSVLLFNQTDLNTQIDVADFNNVETSEESEQSEVFTNIGSSADAHHEVLEAQKSNQISPRNIYSVPRHSETISHNSSQHRADYSICSIHRSESRSSRHDNAPTASKLSLYTLPYYIIRSLNDTEKIRDPRQSMRASFVGDILLEKLPDGYPGLLTTSLKYLMFSGFVFKPSFYAFFDCRKMSYMTLMGMDSLPASMCRPLPYIRHIASLKDIPPHKLSAFDIDKDILDASKQEKQLTDVVGDEARKQRSLAQFKETVRDLLVEAFAALLNMSKPSHTKSKSFTGTSEDNSLIEADDERMNLSATLSSIQMRCLSKGDKTCGHTDISGTILNKLVTDFRTAVKAAEDCRLNTNLQGAAAIFAHFTYLYVFLGPDLFKKLDPRENNHIPAKYVIEQKHIVSLSESESCSSKIYMDSCSECNDALSIPPLRTALANFSCICKFFFSEGFSNSIFWSDYDEDDGEEEFVLKFIEFIVLFFNKTIVHEEVSTILVEFFTVLHESGGISIQTLMRCKSILSTSDDEIDIALHDCVFVQLERLHEDELFGNGQRGFEADDPAAPAKNEASESYEYEYYEEEEEQY